MCNVRFWCVVPLLSAGENTLAIDEGCNLQPLTLCDVITSFHQHYTQKVQWYYKSALHWRGVCGYGSVCGAREREEQCLTGYGEQAGSASDAARPTLGAACWLLKELALSPSCEAHWGFFIKTQCLKFACVCVCVCAHFTPSHGYWARVSEVSVQHAGQLFLSVEAGMQEAGHSITAPSLLLTVSVDWEPPLFCS